MDRVQAHVLSAFGGRENLYLEIRFEGEAVSARDLAAYLGLLDGAFGRTDPAGFRSYSLRTADQLDIGHIKASSTVLEIGLAALGEIEIWRFLVVYLVAKTGPSILKGEAARNWAAATKSLGEAVLVWSDVSKRVSEGRERQQLSRRQRAAIRRVISTDPLFVDLTRRDIDTLVWLVEGVLLRESSRLAAAARFDDKHIIEISLRLRRAAAGDDEAE
jgi:hypothetical protein